MLQLIDDVATIYLTLRSSRDIYRLGITRRRFFDLLLRRGWTYLIESRSNQMLYWKAPLRVHIESINGIDDINSTRDPCAFCTRACA